MKGKGTAPTHLAFKSDFTTEEPGNFAAYGEPQAGASVSTARRTIRLLKGLKHDCMFLRRNPNAGVTHTESDHIGGVAQCRMIKTPAGRSRRDLQYNRSAIGEFASVGEQILEHLLEPLGISLQGNRQACVQVDSEGEAFALRDRTESALDRTADFAQHNGAHVQGNRA